MCIYLIDIAVCLFYIAPHEIINWFDRGRFDNHECRQPRGTWRKRDGEVRKPRRESRMH